MIAQKAKVISQKTAGAPVFDVRQRTYDFAVALVRLTQSVPYNRQAAPIIDQVVRSGTSVGANVMEAKSSTSRLEFKRYYEIALKSANETRYWLHLLRDGLSLEDPRISTLLVELDEIGRILGASIIKLKGGPGQKRF